MVSIDKSSLLELISNIENSYDDPEIISWMRDICKKESDLINSLVLTFLDEFSKKNEIIHNILRALTKLFEFVPDLLLPQLKENKKFPLMVSKYIENTPVKEMEGGAFLLLVSIFTVEGFQSVTNKNFIEAVLSSLGFIQDEKTFKSLIEILIQTFQINPDLIFSSLVTHPNQRFFSEYFLITLNQSVNEGKITDFLNFLIILLQKKKDFFYKNDLEVLFSIIIREAENVNSEETREKWLDLLTITKKLGLFDNMKEKMDEERRVLRKIEEEGKGNSPKKARELLDQLKI